MSDNVAHNLALNLRRLRQQSGLSQQQASNTAQVPRPTWANLESGEANPTLAVLTRVAAALNVSVEELLAPPLALALRYPAEALPTKKRGRVSVRGLLPQPPVGLDIERYVVPPGAQWSEQPHPAGYREYLTCEVGDLELSLADASFLLHSGDVLVFRADQAHHYRNPGRVRSIAYSVISLAGTELG